MAGSWGGKKFRLAILHLSQHQKKVPVLEIFSVLYLLHKTSILIHCHASLSRKIKKKYSSFATTFILAIFHQNFYLRSPSKSTATRFTCAGTTYPLLDMAPFSLPRTMNCNFEIRPQSICSGQIDHMLTTPHVYTDGSKSAALPYFHIASHTCPTLIFHFRAVNRAHNNL